MENSATHQSESNGKRVKLSLNKDTVVHSSDRATSILSSRWKLLWTLVTTLDVLEDELAVEPSFKQIVYRVFALRKTHMLTSLRLIWFSPCDSFDLDIWIHTAVIRNVQQLYLLNNSVQLFELPRIVFTCKTIVDLKLCRGIALDPPHSFQFPTLKILSLYSISYKSDNSFSRLLYGCPVLEDLTVARDGPDGVTDFEIKVPKLKRLTIKFTSVAAESSDCKLEIYAPNLNYFRYDGDLGIVIFLKKLANLVEAHVHIFAEGHRVWNHDNRHYGARILKPLRALNSAKFLELSPATKCFCFDSVYPSIYQNLVRLKLEVKSNWHVLQSLLLLAPNLEVLVVYKEVQDAKGEPFYWVVIPDDSVCSFFAS